MLLGRFAGTIGYSANPKDWAIICAIAGAISLEIEYVGYFLHHGKVEELSILAMIINLVIGATFGGFLGYSFGVIDQSFDGWIAGAIFGILLGTTFGLFSGFFRSKLEEFETNMVVVLISRVIFGGIVGAFAGQTGGAFNGPIGGAIVGALCLVIIQILSWRTVGKIIYN